MQDRTSCQLEEVLLQRTAGPYIGVKRVASTRRDVPAMSASHPITTNLVRHNEPALCADFVAKVRRERSKPA